VAEHVDAGNVHRPERRALGTPESRPRDRIDLLDRVLAGFKRPERLDDTEQTDVVRDEVRRVLGDDHAFAESLVGERRDPLDDVAAGVRCRNHLEQAEISWRVEEMRAEEMAPELVAAALGQR
jgi:hypothetical protein